MVLSDCHRRLWRLWTNFGSSFRSSILLQLWRHLILARIIVRMLIIRWISNPCIHLMCSDMSTWSSIVMRRWMLINTTLVILWNLFWSRSRSWRIIYSILMSIRILLRLLFLAHNTTMTGLLGTRQLIMLITRSIILSLFHRMIWINWSSVLTMGLWITVACHIR